MLQKSDQRDAGSPQAQKERIAQELEPALDQAQVRALGLLEGCWSQGLPPIQLPAPLRFDPVPSRPAYVVAYVPRLNGILGIAYGFARHNVNLPRGQVRLDETPFAALARVMVDQTRVRPIEAHLLLRVAEGGEPTSFYYVTRFEGRPLPSPLGRALWATEQQLLQSTSEGAVWARKVLTLLRRVQA